MLPKKQIDTNTKNTKIPPQQKQPIQIQTRNLTQLPHPTQHNPKPQTHDNQLKNIKKWDLLQIKIKNDKYKMNKNIQKHLTNMKKQKRSKTHLP